MTRRRWVRWVVAITIISSLFLHREWRRTTATRELNAAIAEVEATDPDWTWDRLSAARERPPAGRNGADVIAQVRTQLPEEWTRAEHPERWEPEVPDVPPNVRYSATVVAETRRNLARAPAAVNTVRTLKDFPTGHRDLHLTPDVLSTPLPDTRHTRTVAVLLQWDAELALEDGDRPRAVDDLLAALNTSRSVGDEPLLLSQLVRIGARSVATRSMERIAAHVELTEEQLARLQTAWAADADEPLLLYGLRGERAAYDTYFRNLCNGTITLDGEAPRALNSFGWWIMRVRFIKEHAHYIRWMTQAVEIAKRLPHEQPPLLAAIAERGEPDMIFSQLLLPAAEKCAGAWHRSLGEARCAVVGIACERFRLRHKRWPDTLAELVPAFLPAIPLDPYNGQPLRYAKSDAGVVVYSVGKDLSGAGGSLDIPEPQPNTFARFRLWNPDKRRLPAPPDLQAPPPE